MKKKKDLEIWRINPEIELPLPFVDEGIRAGFPSPAQDYLEQTIDLNRELIRHPATTFYGRVVGDSMKDEGIEEGDVLIIDKSLDVQDNDLVVCFIDGEFTLKRIKIDTDIIWLVPSTPDYALIKVTAENDFMVWGVVTYTIKKNRRKRR